MVANKDMEMPESCALCERFLGACKYTDFGDYQTKRNPSCPLVEIVTCSTCNNWEGNNFGTGYCSTKKKYKRAYDYCSDAKRRE